MKITIFNIKNYKGINDATINLNGGNGSIYTLVGLNESGKTTILEAINSFRHDINGIHATAQKSLPPAPIESLVPKKKKDNFNEDTSIAALVKMSDAEVQKLSDDCKKDFNFQIDVEKFPKQFWVTRKYHFSNSKSTGKNTYWSLTPVIKKKGSRKFLRINAPAEEWNIIVRKIGELFPRIVYFPTFLFNFPERIQITKSESETDENRHFKLMIEDALAFLDDPLNLKTHIIERITGLEPDAPFEKWHPIWMRSDEKDSVETVLDKLSQKISAEIFKPWQDVLGKDFGRKELKIEHIIEPGDNGERVVHLRFKVKDSFTSFKVSERSLGFRWFFCFLLFTRFFRGNGEGGSIFLFDEPASNLHSAAQSTLLKSLEVIAGDKNDIIYSTHSHYLINPPWLETAFIVANGELTNEGKMVDTDSSIEKVDIKALPYRRFVGQNPEKNHYFQPILDSLNVTYSLLEATRQGVLTEGKSDFYILNWYKKYSGDTVNFAFIPIGGADNAGPLISLHLGLCSNFALLLDGDDKGQDAKKRYMKKFPISNNTIILLSDIFEGKIKQIEDLLSDTMKQAVNNKYSTPKDKNGNIDTKIEKGNITRAFSEALSGENDLPLDLETFENLKKLCDALKKAIA